jgi:uncharacterized membrane protein
MDMPVPNPIPGDDPAEMDLGKFKQRMLALGYWLAKNGAMLVLAGAFVYVGRMTTAAVDNHAAKVEQAAKSVGEVGKAVNKHMVYLGAPKE